MIKRLLKTTILLLLFSLVAIYIIKRPSWVQVSDTSVQVDVSVADLKEHVTYLSDVIKSRSYQTGNGLDQASHYIESEFKKHHDRVEVQTYVVNGMSFQNVLAIHGSDNAPVLVVGAHYDTYGGMPGADDNASGVSGILELNRLLAEHTKGGLALKKQIVLVAYTLEEPPIYASDGMGSVIHANSLQSREVSLMISLEMIGYFNDEVDSQDYPLSVLAWIYPDTGHFITVVDELFSTAGANLKNTFNQQGLIEAYSINAPTTIPGIDFSDHRSYWALNIPAVMVTDTAFYRNKYYHTANDTFETLDYQRMSYVVSGVFAHLIKLAK